MAATRAGRRAAAISADGPRWLDGPAGMGRPKPSQFRLPYNRRRAAPGVTGD